MCSCVSMPFFFQILHHTNLSLLPSLLPSLVLRYERQDRARTLVLQGVGEDEMIWHCALITKHNLTLLPSLPHNNSTTK